MLLVDMGFTVLAIGDRVGHESETSHIAMHICFHQGRPKWQIARTLSEEAEQNMNGGDQASQ